MIYSNLFIHLECIKPRCGSNVCSITDNTDDSMKFTTSTIYVNDVIEDFVRGVTYLKETKESVDGDIIILDNSKRIPFNIKLFYIAKIFKHRKQIHLYTSNLINTI